MIEGILWDNDGLLVDTERVYFEANRLALLEAGVVLTHERFLEHNLRHGLSMLDLAREKGWTEAQIQELRRKRDTLYLEMLQKDAPVFPGVESTLAALHGRVRMGIVTSSQRVHFDAIHLSSGLLRYFDFIVALGDYRRGKPNPDPYLEGLARLGLPAERCVAVEDSERGLKAAAAAGLRCYVVPNAQTRLGDFSLAAAVLPEISRLLERLEADGLAPRR